MTKKNVLEVSVKSLFKIVSIILILHRFSKVSYTSINHSWGGWFKYEEKK